MAADAFVLATADDKRQDQWISDEEWRVGASYLKHGIPKILHGEQSKLWDLKKVSILQ
jgi:hypothetical protein